jgi:hypothetical protein
MPIREIFLDVRLVLLVTAVFDLSIRDLASVQGT